jgi:DNA polymerase III delta subunit
MARPSTLNAVLKEIATGKVQPVYLVSGDLVLAEPEARRLAEALAEKAGCAVESHRHPADLSGLLNDLRTYSLFATAKVALVVDAAILADRAASADLVDQAADALPIDDPASLSEGQRLGASRLLQALRVFGVDPQGAADQALQSLPDWALQGGRKYRKKKPRGRGAKQRRELLAGLVSLLEAAHQHGLQGFAEGDLAELGEVLESDLPSGHSLVLAEQTVAADHPLVKALEERGAVLKLARVEAGKQGQWSGLSQLTDELAQETGVAIVPAATSELARRTLRQKGDWRDKKVDAESTARFAGEYRKLASLATNGEQKHGKITLQMVQDAVEDRGEEDVWKILDAVAEGRGAQALDRFRRLMSGAEDIMAARLSFFALLAGFCRQLTAIAGTARLMQVPAGVRSYHQFKDRWAPRLQGDLPQGGKNPLAGLHPFRLHRAYLAASSFDRDEIAYLPWQVLETELQIKGESSEPDVAISRLIAHLAASAQKG